MNTTRTSRRKIDRGKYTTKQQCIDDLMLVWMNALTFNPPMHYVYNAALEFKRLTEARLERMEQEGVEVFSISLKKPRKTTASRSSGTKKEPRERKTSSALHKYERQVNRPPLRNQYQHHQQPQQHHQHHHNQQQHLHHQQQQQKHFYQTAAQPASASPENGLVACDRLLRSLLNLRQHCDFVQPFMHVDAEVLYEGEVPISLTR